MQAVATAPPGPLPTEFVDLLGVHAPRPIHDEVGYQNTTAVIRTLLDEPSLSPGQTDYRETLSVLAEAYERAHHPLGDAPARTGSDMLRYVLGESGTTVEQLATVIGVDGLTAERVLAGQQPPTDEQAIRLGSRFHVRPALFTTR